MSNATVRAISNGFTLTSFGQATIPASVFAASVPEVVYWLGRLFDPMAPAGAAASPQSKPSSAPASAPGVRAIPETNPIAGQEAQVQVIDSGGYLVRQMPTLAGGVVPVALVEVYCASMDAVADALTQIFAAPAPPEEEEA